MDQPDDASVIVTDVFAVHAQYQPEREAVVCGSVRRTWGEFGRRIDRVACALEAMGIGRGDQVALAMGNTVDTLEVMFGVVRAGACVVPLSGLLTGEQLATLADDSDAVALFADAPFRDRLEAHRGRLGKVRGDGWIATGGDAPPSWHAFDAFVAAGDGRRPHAAPGAADRFNIIYSSGTTGLPKGIVQSHRARTHFAFSNAIELGIGANSRALTTTALYSNGTWLMMLPVLFAGGTCVVMPAFDSRSFLDTVSRERITHSFMVPTQFRMVLADPAFDDAELGSLESLLCAGSPLRGDTRHEAIRRFGPKLTELYGFSEGFATMLRPRQQHGHGDSVGTPVLGFEMRIVDDAGRELPRGEVGEIVGHGAGMMDGYHRRPEQTHELVWRDARGRGFLRSGDIGRIDRDGFLHLVDRKKDMIISGGFNVYPADVEAVVAAHPDLIDACVIGMPDPHWGETPLALVVPKPGATIDTEALLAWCNERLARHQRISALRVRDDFPRNALGKVLKRVLRDELARASS